MSAAPSKKPARKPYDRPPNGKGKERADEDAGKVRRPQNSWILYRKDKFELLRKEAETENKPRPIAAEASKIISEAWKNESPEVKKYYNDLAEKEKARHAEEHPDYKFKPKTKAQKLQERESRELAKKRKGDDLRSEREAKLAARSTRGVGSDKMQPPIPSGYPMFYPPFPMGPPPLPGQQPSTHPSAVPWFPFPYPAYLPTPVVYPAGHKTPNPPTTAAEATASESGSGSGHLTPGEAKVTKKRHSTEPNSTTSPQSASSAEASAPADSRATTAFSPPTVTPPTVQQEVGAPKSIPVRSSSTTSSHSAPVSIHFHGCLSSGLIVMLLRRRWRIHCSFHVLLPGPNPGLGRFLSLLPLPPLLLYHLISIYLECLSRGHQHNLRLLLVNRRPRFAPLPMHQTHLSTQRLSLWHRQAVYPCLDPLLFKHHPLYLGMSPLPRTFSSRLALSLVHSSTHKIFSPLTRATRLIFLSQLARKRLS